jgi:hypothetical protein
VRCVFCENDAAAFHTRLIVCGPCLGTRFAKRGAILLPIARTELN